LECQKFTDTDNNIGDGHLSDDNTSYGPLVQANKIKINKSKHHLNEKISPMTMVKYNWEVTISSSFTGCNQLILGCFICAHNPLLEKQRLLSDFYDNFQSLDPIK
jgi:hypothetical protein